jgi:hypothetical protein
MDRRHHEFGIRSFVKGIGATDRAGCLVTREAATRDLAKTHGQSLTRINASDSEESEDRAENEEDCFHRSWDALIRTINIQFLFARTIDTMVARDGIEPPTRGFSIPRSDTTNISLDDFI